MLLSKPSILNFEDMSDPYFHKHKCITKNTDDTFELNLDSSSVACEDFMKKYVYDVPMTEKLNIALHDELDKTLIEFMRNVAESMVYELVNIYSANKTQLVLHKPYLECICNLCLTTTSIVYLTDLKLSYDQFFDILESCRNINKLILLK